MKCLSLAAIIILSCLSGRSQTAQYPFPDLSRGDYSTTDGREIFSSVNGKTYNPTEYAKLAPGSTPFFHDEWMKADLVDQAGKIYTGNAVRLDLLGNNVNFRDPASGQEMVVSTPIKWLRLTDTVKGVSYMFVLGDQLPSINKLQANVWFQVLVYDKVSLCHEMRKTVHQIVVYGDGPQTTISTDDFYFLSAKGLWMPITGWKDLQGWLDDKKDAIDQYIHDHHLKGRAPEDYTGLVRYYNTLGSEK
jgi:hypothetical protein